VSAQELAVEPNGGNQACSVEMQVITAALHRMDVQVQAIPTLAATDLSTFLGRLGVPVVGNRDFFPGGVVITGLLGALHLAEMEAPSLVEFPYPPRPVIDRCFRGVTFYGRFLLRHVFVTPCGYR
jgi:hypothetical protein